MMHKPIQFKNLSLSFPHKSCFEDFNAEILYSSRIAIIGRNGSGKSSLLKILQNSFEATSGVIKIPDDLRIGYVPQVIDDFESCSGGERLNAALTQALSRGPNILLLDEPTNHLDRSNRKSIMRLLRSYKGTLIVVSHDVELLRHCVDTLWHIDNGKIHIFTGSYDDYLREMRTHRASIEQELSRLQRQKKDMHQALMKEQSRAAKSRAKGEKSIAQRKWPTIVSNAKASRSQETSSRKKAEISDKKLELCEQLSALRLPEIIKPTFSLSAADIDNKLIVSVSDGSVHYENDKCLLSQLNFLLMSGDRVAITGDNGSGKSTLVKAIIDSPDIIKNGSWHVPKPADIGYLDQHYATLSSHLTVLETLENLMPDWQPVDLRRHLCNFLFRKNDEVNALVSTLSGGEKARLTLALIAAKTPKLLILDEITNNLDLDAREHIVQVLQEYPGSLIIISHDVEFLRAIKIESEILVLRGSALRYSGQ